MINYVVKKRKNPVDKTAPGKYYLTAKSVGSIGREDFIEDMVKNTSLTANEAATGLDYLVDSVPKFLKLGFTVKLGDMGYFRTSLKSEGTEKEEDAGAGKLKAVKIRFVPGKALKDELEDVKVAKAADTVSSAQSETSSVQES